MIEQFCRAHLIQYALNSLFCPSLPVRSTQLSLDPPSFLFASLRSTTPDRAYHSVPYALYRAVPYRTIKSRSHNKSIGRARVAQLFSLSLVCASVPPAIVSARQPRPSITPQGRAEAAAAAGEAVCRHSSVKSGCCVLVGPHYHDVGWPAYATLLMTASVLPSSSSCPLIHVSAFFLIPLNSPHLIIICFPLFPFDLLYWFRRRRRPAGGGGGGGGGGCRAGEACSGAWWAASPCRRAWRACHLATTAMNEARGIADANGPRCE